METGKKFELYKNKKHTYQYLWEPLNNYTGEIKHQTPRLEKERI